MMKNKYTLLLLILALFSACTKDRPEQMPIVRMAVESTALNGKVNENLSLEAVNVYGMLYDQEWKLNDEVISTASVYNFTAPKSGIYVVEYTATGKGGTFTHKYTINVGVPTVPISPNSNPYVTTMFEFLPAPGQNTNKALGILTAAKTLEGKKGLVSLGAWGGYIVLGFDHTVVNETGKDDLIVYGNPQSNFAEPGIVWVMQDENGNGKPDDTWYELKGSEFGKAGYERNYEVTYTKPAVGGSVAWKDNKGNTGTVNISSATFQSFPTWQAGTEYTLKGSILPKTGLSSSGLITSMPFAFGYADNIVGGDKLDIANAIDKDGKSVSLAGIDFVKIQTGIQANLGILGELSTEVAGVADLSLVK
ncbi:cell surface protein [Pedobacter sp. GR22-6]|uniref:cell surface protein n=1 Tax=Pedobacter sp. GR22-6 TaxID=3127957 RepID=UPI00307CE056